MGEGGIRKVTKIMILFLWIQVTEWSLSGNYFGKNGDFEVPFYLNTKYTVKKNIRIRKMCIFTK